jgi:uncharacterized lipoprotein
MNKLFIFALSVPLIVSGCALTVEEIEIPYQGDANITVVDGAGNVLVDVKSQDKRTVYKDRVGAKKNGYGMEMASIITKQDVAKSFADAISFELENMGFRLGEGQKTLKVDLMRFYNDFKIGFFAGDAVADGLINVSVLDQKGETIFSRAYEGGGTEANIQLATGSNARAALIKAMSNIVGKVAQDKDLHKALLCTAQC